MAEVEVESAAHGGSAAGTGAVQAPRRKRWLTYLREAALLVAVFLAIRAYQTRDALGGQAPALVLTALDGRAFDLATPRSGPLLVYFWASWCGICEAAEHNVSALGADAPVVTVASASGEESVVEAEVGRRGLKFPVVADADRTLARAFGVRAYPTLFVLDEKNEVQSVEVGYTTEIGMRLRLWWAAL